jgi:hypothetical protein
LLSLTAKPTRDRLNRFVSVLTVLPQLAQQLHFPHNTARFAIGNRWKRLPRNWLTIDSDQAAKGIESGGQMQSRAAVFYLYRLLKGLNRGGAAKQPFMDRMGLVLAALLFLGLPFAHAQTAEQVTNQPPVAGPRRPANVPEDYVVTPAGYFHASCVRSLARGERLLTDGRVQHADGSIDQNATTCAYPRYTAAGVPVSPGTANKSTPQPSSAAPTKPEISGWLEDAYITTNSPTRSYGALVARWTVPPQPSSDDGQVLYFFPGFEDIDGVQSILQPVLGWFQGQWTIASWNCCLNGIVTNSPQVNVSPGDRIYGSITSTCPAGTLTCNTWNVLSLDLSTGESTTLGDTPSDGQTFNWAFGAVFEPYYIVSCDDFPSNSRISFDKITVFNEYLKPLPDEKWVVSAFTGNPPECGYAAVQGLYGHEVSLHY